MPLLNINGVNVDFPYEPYNVQTCYMNKVIECLQKSQNGLLESPTGTGKTLCLLCSSLSWLEHRKAQFQLKPLISKSDNSLEIKLKNDLTAASGVDWGDKELSMVVQHPKIIYASRTHSQLAQVIQELKRTVYSYMKISVLGSREQLCIHPDVLKEENNSIKIHMCKAKVGSKTCFYYNTFEYKKRTETNFNTQIMDIEDLVAFGKKNRCCPYYMAREMKASADIIFMPYNYLLDSKARQSHGIELKDNIIIFDEAHNLQNICEDMASFDLKSADIAACIDEVTSVMEKLVEINNLNTEFNTDSTIVPDFTLKDLSILKALLCELEDQIEKLTIPDSGISMPGSYIFELFGKADLTYNKKNHILDLLEKLVTYLATTYSGLFHKKGNGLQKFSDIIKIVFNSDGTQLLQSAVYYKVFLHYEQSKKKRTDLWNSETNSHKKGRIVSYWCFSSGFGMQKVLAQGTRCIILTSGTLSPLDSFAAEMQIPFNIKLENPHVIESHQVWVSTVCKGPDGWTLNSSYKNRSNVKYLASLGNTIVNYARIVPNGLLVFFPSYPMLNECLEVWQNGQIMKNINQYKCVCIEPRAKQEFQEVMHNFYDKANDSSNKGAIFFAVCRGKVSEGLDFADANGRAVIITGLPFPPLKDPKIILKQAFLNEMQGKLPIKMLSGKEWYSQEASRAVNQAIGRVIRHRYDYGAIILCDNRFSQNCNKKELSSWIQPHLKTYETFGQSFKDLLQFFRNAQKTLPLTKPLLVTEIQTKIMPATNASFLPSGSIRVPSSLQDQKGSNSVKDQRKSENISLAEIAVQYGNAETSHSKYPKTDQKRGLLAALEVSQDKLDMPVSNGLENNDIPNFRMNPTKETSKSLQEKKHGLKLKECNEGTKDRQQSVAAYLSQVKRALSAESYVQFSTSLKEYKKTNDFDALVSTLAMLFIDEKHHHSLFRNFYRFVQLKERTRFDEICKNLTGLGCDHEILKDISKPKRQKN